MLARTHHRDGDVAADRGLLLLRLGLATLLISLHGAPRLVRAFQYFIHGESWPFVDFLAGLGFPFPVMCALLSTSAESTAACLVGIGFLTRSAACVIAINMTVAVYVEATGGDPFELPAFYLLGALVVAISGAGSYSLDRLHVAPLSHRAQELHMSERHALRGALR